MMRAGEASLLAATVRFIRYAFLQAVLLVLFVSGFSSGQPAFTPSRPSAERLKTGRFQYRTLVNGKDAGTNEISIAKSGTDRFIFTNKVSGAFAQRWEAVATAMFAPVSAKISFGEGDKLQPRFELNYRDGRAIGSRIDKSTNNRIDVDVKVLPDTVDQRIDWAAAMSQELTPGHEFSFSVFDPVTQISHVTGRVVGPETVNVPAGTFEAMRIVYTIEKPSGKETYQVLTNAKGARIPLKEEFPDGATTELVRFNE
jgi:Protein of unknown function (DUF3108)